MRYLLSILVFILSITLNIIFLPFRIVFSLLGISFPSSGRSHTGDKDVIKMRRADNIVSVNYDSLDEEEQKEYRETITQEMDFTKYNGEVEHAYELTFVKNQNSCPRCQSDTKQHYANFIYATQIAPRVMFAPAGFFCAKCPTVIIDHEMIRKGIAKKFQFQGVVGIDYDTREEPDFFKTWNGKKAVYIFDEDQRILGLIEAPTSGKKQRTKRTRHQIKKKSRRKNRRKN